MGLEWAGLGKTVWQVEKDQFCRNVLAKHWPDVTRHEDVYDCGAHNLEPVDLICGGFPCQDLSIAGPRNGLKGERSGLFFQMQRIINEIKPTYILWENVSGLSTSDRGRDLARILVSMGDIGYFGACRILDAQYFGLAQRRRRWFGLFSHDRDGAERCAEILSISEGMRWHPAPSREAGEGFAADVAPSLTASGRGTERAGDSRGQDPVIAMPVTSGCVPTKWVKGTGGPSGDECQNLIATAYRTSGNCGVMEQGDKTAALNYGTDPNQTIVAFQQNASGEVHKGDVAYTLNQNSNASGRNTGMVRIDMDVRRLTPRECERLQGFQWRCTPDYPDAWQDEVGRWWSPDWTAGASDSARYRMIGNAVPRNVSQWIGERMEAHENRNRQL